MIKNEHRNLLGLMIIDDTYKVKKFTIVDEQECPYYNFKIKKATLLIKDNTIYKLILEGNKNYEEIDYNFKLNEDGKIIRRKGAKPKELTLSNILKLPKQIQLNIDLLNFKYELRVGIKHFKVMYFDRLCPSIVEMKKELIKLYGSISEWEKELLSNKKNKKQRYLPKIGDVFSYPINDNEYVFALIIGKFSEYWKKNLISTESRHYMSNILGTPLIIRTFDFKSKQNQVNLNKLKKINY